LSLFPAVRYPIDFESLGADDKHLAPKDLASVALVGGEGTYKTLQQEIQVREVRITQQEAEIADLKRRLAMLEEMVSRGAAHITSIESNTRAFLKCLIVKNALNFDVDLRLEDFRPFLATCRETYDLVLASGVLYHMTDPVQLLTDMARVIIISKRSFLHSRAYRASVPGKS
jgi:hypothetical protein